MGGWPGPGKNQCQLLATPELRNQSRSRTRQSCEIAGNRAADGPLERRCFRKPAIEDRRGWARRIAPESGWERLSDLKQVELNGLDLPASIADGAAHSGTSRWPAGECAFLIRNRGIVLQWLQLNAAFEQTSVQGTLGFGSDADLSVSMQPRERARAKPKKASAKRHVLKISGPLDELRLTVENTPEPQVVN